MLPQGVKVIKCYLTVLFDLTQLPYIK